MAAQSRLLCAKLRQQDYYKAARHVMIFYPKHGEVDLRELLDDDKQFYLPRVEGELLCPCPYPCELAESEFGVMEPVKISNIAAIDTDNIRAKLDLIIVPALMADKNRNRLGYGGGYYDRFLAAAPFCSFCPSVVLLPPELLTDTLPVEPHDVPVDYIVSC